MKPLGKLDTTSRGFELIEFKDYYGHEASLQQSSMFSEEIFADKPGQSAIWLGLDKETIHEVTGERIGARMHLNREQVESLIAHLQGWLKHGTFKVKPTLT